MRQLARAGRYALAIELLVAVCAILYFGLRDIPMVFTGAPAGTTIRFDVSCGAAESGAACQPSVTELSTGRYRLAATTPTPALNVRFDTTASHNAGRFVLVSVAHPTTVRVATETGGESTQAIADVFHRRVIPVPAGGVLSIVSFDSAEPVPIVVAEFGVYQSERGLLSDPRTFFDGIPPLRYHATLMPRAIAGLCLFTIVAAFFAPVRWLKRANPFALGAVCFALSVLDLAVLYSPYTGRDLRAFYASGPLQEIAGSNLNGALWEAARLLSGRGFTVADGLVSWAKMPGYGLFVAAAGVLLGHKSFVDLAMSAVWLNVWFLSVAVAVFAWTAGQLWRPPVVWACGVVLAMLPKQLGYTQVDTIIPAVGLLIAAALCLRLVHSRSGAPVPLGLDLFVHATFALWFLMRPDVLPGWAVVATAMHVRSPRRLIIPTVLALAIGGAWATYKMRYTGEFSPTVSTVGASLLCGLWEVPSRFPWVCSDDSYFEWVAAHTHYEAKSQAASGVVVREVIRFWATFPGHFIFMAYDKALRCLSGDLWPGLRTDLQVSVLEAVGGRPSLVVVLATAILLALAVGYHRSATAFLAWALFLNAPVFWVMQTSEGRYYGGVGVALVVAAVPLLLDADFYRALALRYRLAATVVACVAVAALAAWPIHSWLLHNDAFHYWTPFLSPSGTSWGVIE